MKNIKTGFIGHALILCKNLEVRLKNAIEDTIKLGCKDFTMGTRGDFDKLALSACRGLRHGYEDINIEVVITSFAKIKKYYGYDAYGLYSYTPFEDVKTVMYDIENEYYKNRITASNKQMIDTCDILICYIDPKRKYSRAKVFMNYAIKRGLKVINLYQDDDNI